MKQKLTGKGNCYEVAGKLIADMDDFPNVFLCHGLVTGQGKVKGIRFGHAWVEINNIVIDISNGKNVAMEKEMYYRIGNIKDTEVKKYSPAESKLMILKTENFGPWDD